MRLAFSEDEIRDAVARIAEAINCEYGGRDLVFLGVLKGSFLFLADLIRRIRIPCTDERNRNLSGIHVLEDLP